MYTVQIILADFRESGGEEVPKQGNFPETLGNKASFPRITWKFLLQGTSLPYIQGICLVSGTVYIF
jgi:hypothetical protein